MTRIFILDDARRILQALGDAKLLQRSRDVLGEDLHFHLGLGEDLHYTIARVFRHEDDEIVVTMDDAFDLVTFNPVFDLWVLDHDLAEGLSGMDFLKTMCAENPDKVPPVVLSCSGNPDGRENIESYARDFQRCR